MASKETKSDQSQEDSEVMIRRIEEEISKTPLKATVTVEALEETQQDEGNSGGSESSGPGKEQYMKIEISFPDNLIEILNIKKSSKTQLIFVADRSGSMSGRPFDQVRQALLDIVTDSFDDETLQINIICYESTAQLINFNRSNYRDVIGSLRTTGGTNFSAAFQKVNETISSKASADIDKICVVFLTDGQDSVGTVKAIQNSQQWAKHLAELNKEVVVHAVGFSRSHDFKFLQEVSHAGTAEGIFRYCEPDDGQTVLKTKIEELFEFVSLSSGQKVDVDVEIEGDNRIVGLGTVKQKDTLQGQITEKDSEGASSSSARSIMLETWVYLENAGDLPKLHMSVLKKILKDKKHHCLRMAVNVESCKRELIVAPRDKMEWAMRILQRNTDILTTKFAETIAKQGDLGRLQGRLTRLQNRISNTPVFGHGVTKEMREMLIGHIRDIQAKIDLMHSMIARYLRGETDSVSMLARAHDLRYEAQFSKSRRQRLMDQRVSKNMSKVKADQEKLQKLVVDKAELDRLSQEATEFFFCALSQNSVKDILQSKDETENAIGFGLAVKRPEHVLDDPTAIRLQVISGTLVSRTSIFDALEYKISVEGHLNAHGGFNFSELGCATVGLSREPINAWLPLYVTKSHWERVKALMKPTLGYFCTLDPLGYSIQQINILFLVLGSMISQLNDANIGEHQIRLIFAMQRTCAAAIADLDMPVDATTIVKNFIESPEGRTKDIVPNLCTLVGYLVAMPKIFSKKFLGYDSDTSGQIPDKARKFWTAFTTECLRRAGGTLLHSVTSEGLLNGIVAQLLSPAKSAKTCSSREVNLAKVVVGCNHLQNQSTEEIKLKSRAFDPTDEMTINTNIEMKHSHDVDRAMSLWAQAKCGVITNKNRDEQVSKAKKTVNRWIREGRQLLGLEEEEDEDEKEDADSSEVKPEYDTDAVDPAMIELMAKLMERLSRSSFPHISAIPGFLAFAHHWLSCDHSYAEMDQNGGLAPEAWVEGVKATVGRVYKEMNEFGQTCDELASSDDETVVVTATDAETVATVEIAEVAGAKGPGETEDLGDDDEFDPYYDSPDEDSPGKVAKRLARAGRRAVALPMVIHCINPNTDHMTLMRAMLCQAVEYHSNSQARGAIQKGIFHDISDYDKAKQTLCELHDVLEKRREGAVMKKLDEILWCRGNYSMLHAENPWSFVGYMMNFYYDRKEGFSALVKSILALTEKEKIPCLPEKIRILLSGKWEDCIVLANGNIWLPEKKITEKFENLIGSEVWSQIEVDLLSDVKVHVYRESDIPNRHGHCNSNPFYPNILRKKLGMPMIQENRRGTRRK